MTYNKNDYYIPFHEDPVDLKTNWVAIERSTYRYVKSLFNPKSAAVNKIVHDKAGVNKTLLQIYFMNNSGHIDLFELKDEYFGVFIYMNRDSERQYKCDQLDGIKELLEDLEII